MRQPPTLFCIYGENLGDQVSLSPCYPLPFPHSPPPPPLKLRPLSSFIALSCSSINWGGHVPVSPLEFALGAVLIGLLRWVPWHSHRPELWAARWLQVASLGKPHSQSLDCGVLLFDRSIMIRKQQSLKLQCPNWKTSYCASLSDPKNSIIWSSKPCKT